ncbi:capsular biosynthesis protein [Halomonas sp. BC2]|uniref:capsular biosynthesis protein n=1 Tax=Halomonas sp. BC2 TaxID=1670449 RepID=UPI001118F438|nr:capsular biosynthesis protein [Halomonas sp. BC2]
MILIASGAYLQGEFVTEVGLIPPSFLPLGNKRLYEHQVELLNNSVFDKDDIFISLPSSYNLDPVDAERLMDLGVNVLPVPDGLSLGDAVLYCWNAAAKHYSDLTILLGDTLFMDLSLASRDVISVHENRGFYKRSTLGDSTYELDKIHDDWSSSNEKVISGYFNFSNPLFLMKSIVEAKGDFIRGVVRYHQKFDLSVVSSGQWLDFGHINSYFQSRTAITTQRAFNDLKITSRTVHKASLSKSKKIFAEGAWFDNIPSSIRLYTPALLSLDSGLEDHKNASYKLEYLYLLPLSDLYVFGRLTTESWSAIFGSLLGMLQDFCGHSPCADNSISHEEINSFYLEKTMSRLDEYYLKKGGSIYEDEYSLASGEAVSLLQIAQRSSKYISPVSDRDVRLVHGDLCFSNLLFDSRVESIKCIDPRGLTPSGKISIYGDQRYDLAKLYHSVIGLYDFIIAGRYKIESYQGRRYISFPFDLSFEEVMGDLFNRVLLEKLGYSEKEILAISVHLFLSMLPLHSDRLDRQDAFILNAIRLFDKLEVH